MLPNRWAARLLLGVLAVVTAVHLMAQLIGSSGLADATQALLMPLLAGVLWWGTSAPRSRLVSFTLAALGFSWLGDTAPKLAAGDPAFLLMVGFFLLAQIAYIVAFLPYRRRSVLHVNRAWLAAYAAVVAALVAACVSGAADMLVPVLVYGACLGTMAVLSTGVNPFTAVGGAIFLLSDGLIALDAFVPGFGLPAQGFWVMLTYVAAQVLLVAGVLRERMDAGTSPITPDAARAR
jgi:uncharacterized membrane protein YhhN